MGRIWHTKIAGSMRVLCVRHGSVRGCIPLEAFMILVVNAKRVAWSQHQRQPGPQPPRRNSNPLRTGSWTGPPRGERAPRVRISSTAVTQNPQPLSRKHTPRYTNGSTRSVSGDPPAPVFFSLFLTLVSGPRRSLRLKLNDARVCEPQIRARLGTTAHFCKLVVLKS